jgi:benzaldehyde dehydrogenase (NAD)
MALLEDGAWRGTIWTGAWTDGSGGTSTAVEPATGAGPRSVRHPG